MVHLQTLERCLTKMTNKLKKVRGSVRPILQLCFSMISMCPKTIRSWRVKPVIDHDRSPNYTITLHPRMETFGKHKS